MRNQPSVEGSLSVTDGTLLISGVRFDRLHGSGRVRLAATGEARVDSLAGVLVGRRLRPIETQTTVRWNPRRVWCDPTRVVLEGFIFKVEGTALANK